MKRDRGSNRYKERGDWERWLPFHDRLDDIVIPNMSKIIRFF